MKRKILLACLFALISTTPVYSYTGACNGGTIIESTTGATFCMSKKEMNWWSAQACCQVNGSRLATMYEMCPSWDGNGGSDRCPELNGKGSGMVWSATAKGNTDAFNINLSNGYVYNYGSRTFTPYAFCR